MQRCPCAGYCPSPHPDALSQIPCTLLATVLSAWTPEQICSVDCAFHVGACFNLHRGAFISGPVRIDVDCDFGADLSAACTEAPPSQTLCTSAATPPTSARRLTCCGALLLLDLGELPRFRPLGAGRRTARHRAPRIAPAPELPAALRTTGQGCALASRIFLMCPWYAL